MSDLSPLCPKCSKKMFKHSDPASTFVLDGWICPNCLFQKKVENFPQDHFGIIVKGLRKAWYEK